MTLQQLEYVLAVDKYRHFVKAAESCGITQSTLSAMIRKLEDELDVAIFDRNLHPVQPTAAGEAIIRQARVVLYHSNQLREQSLSERKRLSGHILLGVSPTIAPYIIPHLLGYMDTLPDATMSASELPPQQLITRLKTAQIDMAIMSLASPDGSLLEIPLYQEKLYAYVSPNDPLYALDAIPTADVPADRLWSLHHEYSLSREVCNLVPKESERRSRYESGNVATLLHIVNHTDGLTVIPELHIPMLRDEHRCNLRPLIDPVPVRQVSLFVRSDYVREGLLNLVADGIKQIIPESMLDSHLSHYAIRL